jgi:hypothetical protein
MKEPTRKQCVCVALSRTPVASTGEDRGEGGGGTARARQAALAAARVRRRRGPDLEEVFAAARFAPTAVARCCFSVGVA